MYRRRTPVAVGVVLALSLIAASCSSGGSTQKGIGPGKLGGAGGQSPSDPSAPDAPDGTDRSPGSAASGSPGGTSGSNPSPTKSTAGTSGTRNITPGPGVTATKIAIGAVYPKNVDALAAMMGVGNQSAPPPRDQIEAVVKWVNANGGIAGRQVTPIYYEWDVLSSDTAVAQAEAMCRKFTEDDKVVAVLALWADATLPAACLADRGVIYVHSASDMIGDAPFFAKYGGYYYVPSHLNYDRMSSAWADGLGRQGYFGPGKYGLLYFDYHKPAIERTLKPALKTRGVTQIEEFEVKPSGNITGAGNTVSQIQSAVLRFKDKGVDHVLMMDMNGGMANFFMREADSQGYYPRYGLSSYSWLEATRAQVPAAQLKNALAVGWRAGDLTTPPAPTKEQALCYRIMTDNGVPASDPVAQGTAAIQCEMWFFMKTGFDRATGANAAEFRRAVEALGSAFRPLITYRTRFAPGKSHDGAGAVQGVKYDTGCSCWKPNGAAWTID